jgi:hypothetical protein
MLTPSVLLLAIASCTLCADTACVYRTIQSNSWVLSKKILDRTGLDHTRIRVHRDARRQMSSTGRT